MIRYLVPLLFLALAALSGCSHRSPEWIAVREGRKAQLYRRNSCRAGALAALESYGLGYYVREVYPDRAHAWAWLSDGVSEPGTYYLADRHDGFGRWGTAGGVAEVRKRHGYDAPKVFAVRYQPRDIYPLHHRGAFP